MSWRISGQGGHWAGYDGTTLTGDYATLAAVYGMAGCGIPLTPTGPMYVAHPTDPVWLYLAAARAVPGPRTVQGEPPPLPALPPLDPAVVY